MYWSKYTKYLTKSYERQKKEDSKDAYINNTFKWIDQSNPQSSYYQNIEEIVSSQPYTNNTSTKKLYFSVIFILNTK